MTSELRKILEKYGVSTLTGLSKELKISLDKIKNISCGRTPCASLLKERRQYRVFPKHSEEFAELVGAVLGDGNIYQFPRCQRLTISCNSSYRKYVKHVSYLVYKIFRKEPSATKRSKVKCVDVRLYMQDIDKALGLPLGNKINNLVRIPVWILKNKKYLIKCLKGLFETDGHYGLSRKFYVEYIQFCNKSDSLRESVFEALVSLKYSPQFGNSYVRLAKKEEVHNFIELMRFVRPFPSLEN